MQNSWGDGTRQTSGSRTRAMTRPHCWGAAARGDFGRIRAVDEGRAQPGRHPAAGATWACRRQTPRAGALLCWPCRPATRSAVSAGPAREVNDYKRGAALDAGLDVWWDIRASPARSRLLTRTTRNRCRGPVRTAAPAAPSCDSAGRRPRSTPSPSLWNLWKIMHCHNYVTHSAVSMCNINRKINCTGT